MAGYIGYKPSSAGMYEEDGNYYQQVSYARGGAPSVRTQGVTQTWDAYGQPNTAILANDGAAYGEEWAGYFQQPQQYGNSSVNPQGYSSYGGRLGGSQYARGGGNQAGDGSARLPISTVTRDGSVKCTKPSAVQITSVKSADEITDSEESRKVFVGGLDWETTADQIHEYFEQFGPVLEVKLKTDIVTGRSRGFAFLLFQDSATVDKVMDHREHLIQGKKIDPKRAIITEGNVACKKIFVGGIDPTMTEQEIVDSFSQYGKVLHVELPVDRQSNQRRSFGFVMFETEEAVEAVCQQSKVKLGTKMVDIRKVMPKDEMKPRVERSSIQQLAIRGFKKRGGMSGFVPAGYQELQGSGMMHPGYEYFEQPSNGFQYANAGYTTLDANGGIETITPIAYGGGARGDMGNNPNKGVRGYHPYSR